MALQFEKAVSDVEFKAELQRLLHAHGLVSEKPTDEELENAVIRYKKTSNEEGKKQGRTRFFVEDGTVDFFLLGNMAQRLESKLRYMCVTAERSRYEAHRSMENLALVGTSLGVGLVTTICAYYWGKRSSASRAQLAVGGWDSSINLPRYG